MRVDGAVPNAIDVCPVVDVFAATKSFTLSSYGLALLPPFTVLTAIPRLEPRLRPRSESSFTPSFHTAATMRVLPSRLSRSTKTSVAEILKSALRDAGAVTVPRLRR